jgi:hypothetical protein
MMKRWIRLLSAASLLFASAGAYAADATYVFESISSVETDNDTFAPRAVLTGLLANDPTPVSVSAARDDSTCTRYYDVMLQRPGEFTLTFTVRTTTYTTPGGNTMTNLSTLKCSLTRNP